MPKGIYIRTKKMKTGKYIRTKETKEKDNIRTKELLEKGIRVWRIWENEIRKMDILDFREQLMVKIK